MSITPVFDAVLADSDPDIYLAGNIFPWPVRKDFAETWRNIGCPGEWVPVDPRWKAKVTGVFASGGRIES